MPEGVVKWFNTRKGFGFISSDNGPDVFVHFSEFVGGDVRYLMEGGEVLFDLIQGEMGPKASKVTKKNST